MACSRVLKKYGVQWKQRAGIAGTLHDPFRMYITNNGCKGGNFNHSRQAVADSR